MSKTNEKEIYLGVVLTYVTTFVSLGMSLVFTPIIIRLLGQSEYGLYETMGSFVAYLAVLDLGFGAVVTRYTARYQIVGDYEARDRFLYTCRNIYLLLCAIILILGSIFYIFIDKLFGHSFTPLELQKAHTVFLIVLGCTVMSIYSQVYKGCLNGVEKFVWPKSVQLIKVIFTKIVAIALLLLGGDSIGYTAVLFAFEILSCIFLAWLAHRNVSFVRNKMPRRQLLEIFTFTSYLFVLAIVSQLYWQIDKLLLGIMVGTVTVAIYAAAMNIENIIRNVSSSLKEILIPRISHIAEDDPNRSHLLTEFMIRSGRVILIAYGLMLVCITSLGEKFIVLWLGEEYAAAFPVLLILGYSTLLPTALIPGEEICKTYNRHGPLTLMYLIIALLNVVLTILMVRYWGIMGAASSTAIGLIVGNVIIALAYYHHTFDINIFQLIKGLFHKLFFSIIIVTVVGLEINQLLPQMSWIVLIIQGLIIVLVFSIVMWFYGFNLYERQLANRIILRYSK